MPYTGVLSDDSIKKSCASFFVQNPVVATALDPGTVYEKNGFLTGVVALPTTTGRKRPKRAYDDLATFLSLSGQTSKIQAGVDEYNRQAVAEYEKRGEGTATSSSTQLPFKEDDDLSFGAESAFTRYSMLASTIGVIGLGAAAMRYLGDVAGRRPPLLPISQRDVSQRGSEFATPERLSAGDVVDPLNEIVSPHKTRSGMKTAFRDLGRSYRRGVDAGFGDVTPLAEVTLAVHRLTHPFQMFEDSLADTINYLGGLRRPVGAFDIRSEYERRHMAGDMSGDAYHDARRFRESYDTALGVSGQRSMNAPGGSEDRPDEFPYGQPVASPTLDLGELMEEGGV